MTAERVEIGPCVLYRGDCLDVLPTLTAGSVDAVVTSPLYDNLRQYRSGTALDVTATASELARVVVAGGVVVWIVADGVHDGSESGSSFRHALAFMDAGFRLHDTMIYAKKNPVPKSSPHRRYEQAFEYMFVFSRGKPRVFNALTERCKLAGVVRATAPKHRRCGHDPVTFHGAGRPINGLKVRSNIWYYSVKYVRPIGHPATFPVALATDHILTWSNPGGTVLDPFAGSFTTAVACVRSGRRFIGCELSEEYFEVARKRVGRAVAEPDLCRAAALAGVG